MKNRRLIIANLCAAIVLALLAGTFAAYTSLSSAKRVVSTMRAEQLFSSNILLGYEEGTKPENRTMSFSTDAATNSFRVNICNYSQGNKTVWASSNITYTMSVKLIDETGTEVTNNTVLSKYAMDGVAFTDISPISTTLICDMASEDSYVFTVPTEYMTQYRIYITAKATNISSYVPIGRIISAAEYTSQTQWSGTFLDSEMTQEAYDLGAINTLISGQEHANMTIRWNMDHVDIDPWFLVDMGLTHPTADGDGWCEITFEVGGIDGAGNLRPTQYNIGFYRTKAVHENDAVPETRDDIKSYITFSSVGITD